MGKRKGTGHKKTKAIRQNEIQHRKRTKRAKGSTVWHNRPGIER